MNKVDLLAGIKAQVVALREMAISRSANTRQIKVAISHLCEQDGLPFTVLVCLREAEKKRLYADIAEKLISPINMLGISIALAKTAAAKEAQLAAVNCDQVSDYHHTLSVDGRHFMASRQSAKSLWFLIEQDADKERELGYLHYRLKTADLKPAVLYITKRKLLLPVRPAERLLIKLTELATPKFLTLIGSTTNPKETT